MGLFSSGDSKSYEKSAKQWEARAKHADKTGLPKSARQMRQNAKDCENKARAARWFGC